MIDDRPWPIAVLSHPNHTLPPAPPRPRASQLQDLLHIHHRNHRTPCNIPIMGTRIFQQSLLLPHCNAHYRNRHRELFRQQVRTCPLRVDNRV
jgi:hypothetical protein